MKKGFTCGSFDLLHAGHALMLKECKDYCDYLIVGVQSNPNLDRKHKNRPIMSHEERTIMVKSIRWVDEVVLYNTEDDLVNLLKKIDPDVRILGADWRGQLYTGHDLKIPVIFNSRNHHYSTTYLRERVYMVEHSKRNKVSNYDLEYTATTIFGCPPKEDNNFTEE